MSARPRYKWTPMQRATTFKPIAPALIDETMKRLGLTEFEARAALTEAQGEVWINDTYQVETHMVADGLMHLNIRRRDGAPIMRDWRHFQRIKNEIVGAECEGVELYPAESRLVDESNKYHLFVVTNPAFRFPFGFDKRNVDYSERKDAPPGMRQRPL